MKKLHEIRVKSDIFCSNINQKIEESILYVEPKILDLTKSRLFNQQKDSFGNDMPEYSSKWKAIKGLTYWNLYQTGQLFNQMFLSISRFVYTISSRSSHLRSLKSFWDYDFENRFFAISEKDSPKAKQLSLKGFAAKYKSQVLK